MSPQWEAAKHCQMALSLLSAKIKQMDRRPHKPNPHAYTQRHPGEIHSMDSTELRHKDLSMAQIDDSQARINPITEQHNDQTDGPLADTHPHGTRPGLDLLGPLLPGNFNGELLLAEDEMPSSELNFQNAVSSQFGGSSFDLNMADLLQGADFNSLFNNVGQQYPSF